MSLFLACPSCFTFSISAFLPVFKKRYLKLEYPVFLRYCQVTNRPENNFGNQEVHQWYSGVNPEQYPIGDFNQTGTIDRIAPYFCHV